MADRPFARPFADNAGPPAHGTGLLATHLFGRLDRIPGDFFPDRNKNWWILTPLQDPSALPLLNYYTKLPAPKDQQQQLTALIVSLQRSDGGPKSIRSAVNRQGPASAARLLNRLTGSGNSVGGTGTRVVTWGVPSATRYRVRIFGPLNRGATVHINGGRDQHWEYLYDCWRNTEVTAKRSQP